MNRWTILGPAFLAALALVVFSDPPQETVDVAQPVSAARITAAHAPAATRPDEAPRNAGWRRIDRAVLYPLRSADAVGQDLFAGRQWITAAAAPAEPASAPSVPDFPFSYAGKKWDAGRWEVFLTRGDETLIVKEGDVVEPGYRVAKISPPEMSVVYLPMDHVQVVAIGEGE